MLKLKAFTIIELLIAMIVSTIVIGLAFTLINRTEMVFKKSFDANQKALDLLQLQAYLYQDGSDLKYALVNNDILTIERSDNEIINYSLSDNYIIRSAKNVRDTFRMDSLKYFVNHLFQSSPFVEDISISLSIEHNNNIEFSTHFDYSDRTKFTFEDLLK